MQIQATEAQEQRTFVHWLNRHKILKDFYCKIHNECTKSASHGYQLQLLGLRSGVSDIFIYYPANGWHGLWIEMKRNREYTRLEKNTKTWRNQLAFIEMVKRVGYQAKICYGCDDAIKTVDTYLHSQILYIAPKS